MTFNALPRFDLRPDLETDYRGLQGCFTLECIQTGLLQNILKKLRKKKGGGGGGVTKVQHVYICLLLGGSKGILPLFINYGIKTARQDLVQIGQTGGAGRGGGGKGGGASTQPGTHPPQQRIFCEHQCVISSWSRPGEFLMHHLFPPHLSIQPSGEGDVLLTTGVWKWLKQLLFSSNLLLQVFVAWRSYTVDRILKCSYQLTTSGVS